MSEELSFTDLDEFGLTPLLNPPTTESVLNLVDRFVSSYSDWKKSKSLPEDELFVYYNTVANEPWYIRSSVHNDEEYPFAWFKKALLNDHFGNMVNYYDIVQSFELAKKHGDWNGYTLKYLLPSPFANRDLATWLFTTESATEDEFTVVAVPADIPLPENSTRAVYSFFHRVTKDADGRVTWILGTTSDMKGNLPRWIQSMSIPGILVNDLSSFLDWIADNYGADDNSTTELS
ncbi:hypothetical protein V1514DRAFT_359500 [Lipomyces japonicus]|uniref:uncharacterized protein n=1 Tax=Lipomyces japonicus TaxID=56871 RepID=UPI0034CDEEB7